jgi:1-acyl-sn-glycerol-3-phosphate acyltransferase
MQAEEMAAAGLPLEVLIGWHLQSNHFPPVSPVWNPVAIAAIKACNDDAPDREVALPEGVESRDGHTTVEAWRIVESFRLDPFIYYKEDC